MRKDFGSKPWVYPMPVLVVSAYNEAGGPEAMTVGWAGILDPQHLSLCVMDYHKTTHAIQASGAFTAAVADFAHLEACDYVGTVSGNDVADKVARSGFHTERSAHVNAPIITDLPMALECTLESYDAKTGTLIGKIVNVSADEQALNADGLVDADRFETLAYDPALNAYRKLGSSCGIATQVCDPKKF